MKKLYEISLSENILMQFYISDECRRIFIKIIDVETMLGITLLHDQVIQLIHQIKQFDKIDIQHPDLLKHEKAFYIHKHFYSSRLIIRTITEFQQKIILDDVALLNLSRLELDFKTIIEDIQLLNQSSKYV